MGRLQNITNMLKRGLSVVGLGIILLGFTSIAQAISVSGKVYLDFDNSGSLVNSPPTLSGMNVELLNSAGNPLSPAVTAVTSANGDFTLNAPSIGSYQVKATTGTVGEQGVTAVAVTGSSAVTGRNVMLKGLGGDLTLNVSDTTATGIQNITTAITAAGMSDVVRATDIAGEIIIANTLIGKTYTVSVNPSDIIADTSNGNHYALWNTTLPDNTQQYVDTFTATMAGADQSATFNVRERNQWGADGIVAVDQDDDGIYTPGVDTGAAGVNVEVYYQGTTTKVLGQPAIITGTNGKYNFKNLALGNYTVKITNISAPWQLVTTATHDFTILATTGNPTAFNFLVNVDPNNTTLPKISGHVFALAPLDAPVAGPDRGQTGNTVPNAASPRLQTTVKLYQHDGTTWQLLSSQMSKADGSYAFKGLVSGKDYKVVLDESSINLGAYYFIGDSDGKSTSTAANSLSSHKGKVTLSNGTQDNIAGKEIIVVNLTNAKTQRNFWYSTISDRQVYMYNYIHNLNNSTAWGGTVNGLSASSMSAAFSGRFYEEDGVTLATKVNGSLINTLTFGSLPDGYSLIGQSGVTFDHSGAYTFILNSYDTTSIMSTTGDAFYIPVSSAGRNQNVMMFRGVNLNRVTGHIYINKSHPGLTGSYDPGLDDIPVFASRIYLYRKQVSTGTWQMVSYYASDANGYYNFTNLPDGDYRIEATRGFGVTSNISSVSDVEFEGNVSPTGAVVPASSKIELSVAGGQIVTDQDHWYKLTTTDYIITGSTYLNTRIPGVLNIGQPNNENDVPLYGVTVLLCHDGSDSDCSIGGVNYIAHQITTVNGQFQFTGTGHGLTSGTNYRVKAIKNGLTLVNAGALAPSYSVNFTGITLPVRLNFLLQGTTTYAGSPVNDLDGNRSYLGVNTAENGNGKTDVYYHDGSTWKYWFQTGFFYQQFDIRFLPQGKYKVVHVATPSLYIDIADSDPSNPPGTVEFEVLADGTIADGQPSTNRHFYQAKKYTGVTEGVSGQIYLDVSGNGSKDSRSIALPSSELTSVTVKGYFTPRLYPNYTVGEAAVLSSPDFTDSAVATNNGRFAHTAANSTAGDLYITNYLLKLDGLDTSKFELVANSGTKQSYLSANIQNDLAYMQVNGSVSGSTDQYWLVKLKTPTKISGQLYYDLNGNNSYDSGIDIPMSGVRVELWQSGTLYTYTNADINGRYAFIGLLDGTYDVKVTTIGLDSQLYELEDPLSGIYNGLTVNAVSMPTLTDYDFTYKKIGDASISGHVMLDINNSGIPVIDYNKQGDIPLVNMTVELYKNSVSGLPYKTTQTNNKGYYSFAGMDLNTNYIVKVLPTSGYGVINNADHVASDTLVAIVISATPSSHTNKYFLLAGGSNSNPGAGNGSVTASNSGISGQTLIDDGLNTPLAGVLLSLVDGNGVELVRQLTDNTGNYHFYNLPSDTYKIVVLSSPSGYALVRNVNGTTPPLDHLTSLTLASNGVSGKSFWYKTASVDGIQGKVYVDFAANNTSTTLDSNDHPLSGVTVALYDGLGATGIKLSETTTNAQGLYKFENLSYGTGVDYSVKIDMSSIPNYNFELSKAGNAAGAIVIDVANLPQAGVLNNDYFVVGKLQIDGDVWIDIDGDLVQSPSERLDGVTVNLNYKAPGTSSFSLLKSVTTGTLPATTGQYLFSRLPAGSDYQVVVDSSASVLNGTSLIANSGSGSIAGNTDTFTFTGLAANSSGNSTAYRYNGVVSGQMSIDIDGTGRYTSTLDNPLTSVNLTLSNGLVTKTTTTDAQGIFSFDNLPIGNWSLTTSATQTLANWSSYNLSYTTDSLGATTTGSSALPLSIAITATTATATNIKVGYTGSASISGYIVVDMDPNDGSNAMTGTDLPITNVTVTLSSNTPGFVSRTTTTNPSGYYSFTGLAAHTYKVTVDTTSSADFAGHVVSFNPLSTTVSTVDLAVSAVNTTLTTQDFGYKSNGSLSGYIYRDLGGQGTRHSTVDDKLAGVRVKATQGSLVRYSNITAADGEFKIENLPTGLWTVTLDTLPANYSYSYQSDAFGQTATVVSNGIEIEIDPTAVTRAGVRGSTVSFGLRAAASITGKVVIDVDDQDPAPPANPNVTAADIDIDAVGFYPGYQVNLLVGSTLVASETVTAGSYSFTGLSNNIAYNVEVLSPSGDYMNSFTLASTDSGVTAGVVVNTAAKMSRTYTLAATNTVATNSHFGWKGVGGISGEVFWDKDDDGIFSSGIDSDVGANVTVTLTHNNGSVPLITRTVNIGTTHYAVTGLLPGSWTITTSGVPSNFKASFDPDDAFNPTSLASTPNTANITIGATTLTNQHFGYIQGGIITGGVKHDHMASGNYHSSHPGIEPVDVALLEISNVPVLDVNNAPLSALTNSAGEFSFRNLDPSRDYQVQVAFGDGALTSSRLADMEPSYDSHVGSISLSGTVSATVDVTNNTHTVPATVSSAVNNQLFATDLYLGYRAMGGDLTIHKTALKATAVVGDIVPYTITIENNKAITAFNVTIQDLIPAGFKYVDGSARLDGVKIADPTGGRPLYFAAMDIGGNGSVNGIPEKRTLSYMLVVGAGVTQGEYVNTAQALDRTGKAASNTAQATVTVTTDPLFNDSLIFGKVYIDHNGNGVQDIGDEGLSGVKLVTARGEIITTDSQGRYHLTGVDGGRWERGTNFILKLDTRSLPAGYKLQSRNPQVVRLSPGLPSKIDFIVVEQK